MRQDPPFYTMYANHTPDIRIGMVIIVDKYLKVWIMDSNYKPNLIHDDYLFRVKSLKPKHDTQTT